MSKQTVRLPRRQAFALAAVLALVLGMLMNAPSARAQEAAQEAFSVTNSEFRWGLSKQSSGPSHGPGHNFLSAGDISGAITAPNTMIKDSDWEATSGNVTVEKRDASGKTATATFAGTKTDQSGTPFSGSTAKYGGLEAVFANGKGTVNPSSGTAEIKWDGTVSVLYYSGFVYMTISNPVLTVTTNKAQVTATMGGHTSSREGDTDWKKLTPRKVVVADLDRSSVELGGEKGFSVTPEYLNVAYTAKNGDNAQVKSGDYWGSFPSDFVDFASDAGSASFWYSSGTSDTSKPALPITVSWDSDEPEEVIDSGNSGGSKGVLGQVFDDTIEDILRAAGTDVSDTAAAWMDEAWKPLQPDAVNAQTDAPAGAATTVDDGNVVSEVDTEFEEYYEEYYTAGAPITAGTVAATVGSIPASSSQASGTSASPASAPATNPADQATVQMAASSPLYGSDVVYAQTSASSEAGNPTHQWQWWVGAALLALAAMLVYQTVRRKD